MGKLFLSRIPLADTLSWLHRLLVMSMGAIDRALPKGSDS